MMRHLRTRRKLTNSRTAVFFPACSSELKENVSFLSIPDELSLGRVEKRRANSFSKEENRVIATFFYFYLWNPRLI